MRSLGLENIVEFKGYIPQTQLAPYFKTHNIGVSFVPINDYYNCQPPTKTYEYILSGMPTIATRTLENCKIVCENNGILINDDRCSFGIGLKFIVENVNKYNSSNVRDTLIEHTWENIIKTRLLSYLQKTQEP